MSDQAQNESQQNRWPVGFQQLVWTSYPIRQEIEFGGYQTYKPYKATDWSKEDKSVLDGWDESKGSCEKCNTLRALNGSCNC